MLNFVSLRTIKGSSSSSGRSAPKTASTCSTPVRSLPSLATPRSFRSSWRPLWLVWTDTAILCALSLRRPATTSTLAPWRRPRLSSPPTLAKAAPSSLTNSARARVVCTSPRRISLTPAAICSVNSKSRSRTATGRRPSHTVDTASSSVRWAPRRTRPLSHHSQHHVRRDVRGVRRQDREGCQAR